MGSSYVASRASLRKVTVAWLALSVCSTAVFLNSRIGRAQAPTKSIDDTWQGTLHMPQRDLRTVLKVARGADGALAGTMYFIEQGGQPIKTSSLSFEDGTLKFVGQALALTYEGKPSADGKSITGTSTLASPADE